MKEFKPELFGYELEVGKYLKNQESGASDILCCFAPHMIHLLG